MGASILINKPMEEIIWNFQSPCQLWIKLVDSNREFVVNGSIVHDNHVFFASLNDLNKCRCLSPQEKTSVMEVLSYRTRNDKVRIEFV